jgi:signal transduction histidine kinase
MIALIENLLRYARTGGVAVQSVPVALEPVVRQIAATFSDRIGSSGTRFEATGPFATPLGDPTLIDQILGNLVDNALKYHHRDVTPEVRVSAVSRDGQVVIRVADNGIGIEPEFHAKIFEVFQRLHAVGEYHGSGIGLAIVAKSVRLMGGEVRVESTPGRGSTFSVCLPAAEQPGTP